MATICLRLPGTPEDLITTAHPCFALQGRCYAGVGQQAQGLVESVFDALQAGDSIWGVTLLILSSDGSLLCGWYEQALGHRYEQYQLALNRSYHFSCPQEQAFMLRRDRLVRLPPALRAKSDLCLLSDQAAGEMRQLIDAALENGSLFSQLPLTAPSQDLDSLLSAYAQNGDVRYLSQILTVCQGQDSLAHHDAAGYALMELGLPEDALERFDQALAKEPDCLSAAKDRAECLLRLGRGRQAIQALNDLLHRYPDDDDIRLSLGLAYGRCGYESAAQQTIQAIKAPDIKAEAQAFLREDRGWMSVYGRREGEMSLQPLPLFLPLDEVTPPTIHQTARGRDAYLDPIRGKLITVSPEESLRQQMLSYLMIKQAVPRHAIRVEESLAHVDRSLRDRADILVLTPDGSHLMLIELKASGLPLQGEATSQVMSYRRVLRAPYVMLSNGEESYVYHWQAERERFQALSQLPSYPQMLAGQGIAAAQSAQSAWRRPSFDSLSDPAYQDFAIWDGMLSRDTPPELRPAILNLAQALQDDAHRLPEGLAKPGWGMLEDKGCVYKQPSNAGGGNFFGRYRWLSLRDTKGQQHNVYLGIFGVAAEDILSKRGQRLGYTSLVCAVDEKAVAVSRLHLRLDRCLIPQSQGHRLTHDGRRSGASTQDLLTHIAAHAPQLLGQNEAVLLGELETSRDLRLSDPDTADVIFRLSIYVLLRSQLKAIERERD